MIDYLEKSISKFKEADDKIGVAKATFLKYEILVNNDSDVLKETDCKELEIIGRDLNLNGNF